MFPFLELRTHGTPGLPVRGWSSVTVWRGGFLLGLFEVLLKEHLRFLLRLERLTVHACAKAVVCCLETKIMQCFFGVVRLRVLALSEIVPTINGINMANVALQVGLNSTLFSLHFLICSSRATGAI